MPRYLPLTRKQWDRLFLAILPALALAALIGVAFGGPPDNLIVLGWLLPAWMVARRYAPSTRPLTTS